MRVVHFCSYYVGSEVYKRLVASLACLGVEQTVFVPIRRPSDRARNPLTIDSVEFKYARILSGITKFSLLIKVLFISIYSIFSLKRKCEVVHCHTLYTDGLAGYIYSRIKRARYVVTVRNTDVNVMMKYFPHYKYVVRYVLKNADAVIFVSPAYKRHVSQKFYLEDARNFYIIPNGISDYYCDNSVRQKIENGRDHGVNGIYVGRIDRNKNIEFSIKAFQQAFGSSWTFTIVGGSYSEYLNHYAPLSNEIISKVHFIDKINDPKVLADRYDRADVFCMPSLRETFGLVYIEAISRCLPIIYSQGQGVDGYFEEGQYGYSCNPESLESISDALQSTVKRFPNGLGPFPDGNPANDFSWNRVARRLVSDIYIA